VVTIVTVRAEDSTKCLLLSFTEEYVFGTIQERANNKAKTFLGEVHTLVIKSLGSVKFKENTLMFFKDVVLTQAAFTVYGLKLKKKVIIFTF